MDNSMVKAANAIQVEIKTKVSEKGSRLDTFVYVCVPCLDGGMEGEREQGITGCDTFILNFVECIDSDSSVPKSLLDVNGCS
jgi:hypothetical protein